MVVAREAVNLSPIELTLRFFKALISKKRFTGEVVVAQVVENESFAVLGLSSDPFESKFFFHLFASKLTQGVGAP